VSPQDTRRDCLRYKRLSFNSRFLPKYWRIIIESNGLYLTGYNYQSAEIPNGYYLVIGHLEVTPDTYNGDYMYFGISTTTNLVNSSYSKYYSFHSTHKDTFDLMHYIANNSKQWYYFIFNASTEVEVTSSKCTFIRIA
jgi:hypothetical protein